MIHRHRRTPAGMIVFWTKRHHGIVRACDISVALHTQTQTIDGSNASVALNATCCTCIMSADTQHFAEALAMYLHR